MHPNHAYLLSIANESRGQTKDLRFLDYGCGTGEVVFAARELGIDAFGADTFYEGGDSRASIPAEALGNSIREIREGRIDFPDEHFDLVVCNQVFEHVANLAGALAEIRRVLKPNGKLIAIFPTAEVLREGHIGIPFAHWLSRDSALRYYWTLAFRFLGLGYYKGSKPKRQWSRDALEWIDRFTFYRSPAEIQRLVEHSSMSGRWQEDELISFRLSLSPRRESYQNVLRFPGARTTARLLFRRLAGHVLHAKKAS